MTDRYRTALLDWLACAARGAREPAAVAARAAGDGLLERVAAAGAAGHVLDFDDTYAPGLAHLSAATAPAAVVLGAELGADVGAVLDAYATGFEAMGALARTCHPALYDGGWHPTAVCGSAGAALTAARLLGLDRERSGCALALALLRAGGLRAAFGSDGKALQVGLAAGAATIDGLLDAQGAIEQNWIKAYPCCLQTHAPIDAALAARVDGPLPRAARSARAGDPPPSADRPIAVIVHPVSRLAAAVDAPRDGLEAKFSIPYLTAFALLHGAPGVEDFAAVDGEAAALGARVEVRTDRALAPDAALLTIGAELVAQVQAPRGCPANPLDRATRRAKLRALAGDALLGALDDPRRPATSLLALALAVK
jgi:2-methylcitrate dehydratase PrpD